MTIIRTKEIQSVVPEAYDLSHLYNVIVKVQQTLEKYLYEHIERYHAKRVLCTTRRLIKK